MTFFWPAIPANSGCASFAPTFTQDGKKILFSSKRHACDSRKFERDLMNLDGSGWSR